MSCISKFVLFSRYPYHRLKTCDFSAALYKAEHKHRVYLKIDRFYPSSKLCHMCGFKYCGLKLDERFWTCPSCGTYLDRDGNAAINILNEGLKILNLKYPDGTGESGTLVPKPIDTGYSSNLESELLTKDLTEGPLL